MPYKNAELAAKIKLWDSPMSPLETLEERYTGKEAWITSLELRDLQQLYELLLLPQEDLIKLGIDDFDDFQFELSCIFGQVGKRFLDQALSMFNKLISVDRLRIWLLIAIEEVKSEQCYPVLSKVWNDFQLTEKELIGLINALEATPGLQSLELLKVIVAAPNLTDAVKYELDIAFKNRQLMG